jgi:hypothetical protein
MCAGSCSAYIMDMESRLGEIRIAMASVSHCCIVILWPVVHSASFWKLPEQHNRGQRACSVKLGWFATHQLAKIRFVYVDLSACSSCWSLYILSAKLSNRGRHTDKVQILESFYRTNPILNSSVRKNRVTVTCKTWFVRVTVACHVLKFGTNPELQRANLLLIIIKLNTTWQSPFIFLTPPALLELCARLQASLIVGCRSSCR